MDVEEEITGLADEQVLVAWAWLVSPGVGGRPFTGEIAEVKLQSREKIGVRGCFLWG
jgi:hypothetical protein